MLEGKVTIRAEPDGLFPTGTGTGNPATFPAGTGTEKKFRSKKFFSNNFLPFLHVAHICMFQVSIW
jgi:hypothetical protein